MAQLNYCAAVYRAYRRLHYKPALAWQWAMEIDRRRIAAGKPIPARYYT